MPKRTKEEAANKLNAAFGRDGVLGRPSIQATDSADLVKIALPHLTEDQATAIMRCCQELGLLS